jgi:hypothetical protein
MPEAGGAARNGDNTSGILYGPLYKAPNGRREIPMQSQNKILSSLTAEQPDTKSGRSPEVPYWHLWTDEQGISHQQRCALSTFALKGVGGAEPQWNDKQQTASSTVVFTVQPVGWVGDWHENPAPQWIVVLSGRWWIESMDGKRIEQGPGEFSFGEDQGCTETNGRKGHRSGTIGEAPAVLMTVQLHVDPVRAPCHIS